MDNDEVYEPVDEVEANPKTDPYANDLASNFQLDGFEGDGDASGGGPPPARGARRAAKPGKKGRKPAGQASAADGKLTAVLGVAVLALVYIGLNLAPLLTSKIETAHPGAGNKGVKVSAKVNYHKNWYMWKVRERFVGDDMYFSTAGNGPSSPKREPLKNIGFTKTVEHGCDDFLSEKGISRFRYLNPCQRKAVQACDMLTGGVWYGLWFLFAAALLLLALWQKGNATFTDDRGGAWGSLSSVLFFNDTVELTVLVLMAASIAFFVATIGHFSLGIGSRYVEDKSDGAGGASNAGSLGTDYMDHSGWFCGPGLPGGYMGDTAVKAAGADDKMTQGVTRLAGGLFFVLMGWFGATVVGFLTWKLDRTPRNDPTADSKADFC